MAANLPTATRALLRSAEYDVAVMLPDGIETVRILTLDCGDLAEPRLAVRVREIDPDAVVLSCTKTIDVTVAEADP